jgi:hypothetical protein
MHFCFRFWWAILSPYNAKELSMLPVDEILPVERMMGRAEEISETFQRLGGAGVVLAGVIMDAGERLRVPFGDRPGEPVLDGGGAEDISPTAEDPSKG